MPPEYRGLVFLPCLLLLLHPSFPSLDIFKAIVWMLKEQLAEVANSGCILGAVLLFRKAS